MKINTELIKEYMVHKIAYTPNGSEWLNDVADLCDAYDKSQIEIQKLKDENEDLKERIMNMLKIEGVEEVNCDKGQPPPGITSYVALKMIEGVEE